MDRASTTKLPTANGNMSLTEEEKLKIIDDAAAAYEKYLDALRIDWRNDPNDGMVFQGGIPVKSFCSHHHLPFSGRAHVAYIPSPSGKVIGLSKLNRIVEHYARRPQIQEGLTIQIHKAIDEICEGNKGVAVMISATHTCACLRGIKHDGCEMKTSRLSSDFLDDGATRNEFYQFVSDWRGSCI